MIETSSTVTVLVLARGYGGCTPGRIGQFAGIVFETDDIRATFEEWKARGVRFTEEPFMQSYGQMQAQFTDPDGNVFVLVGKE